MPFDSRRHDPQEHTAVIPYAALEHHRVGAPSDHGDDAIVEASLTWGDEVLALSHTRVRAGCVLRVRDLDLSDTSNLDLRIAARGAGDAPTTLLLPNGERVPAGFRMNLHLGRAILRLALVPDDSAPLPRSFGDGRVSKGVLAAAILHATLLALAIVWGAPAGDEEDAARSVVLRGYIAAIEERAAAEGSAETRAAQDSSATATAPIPQAAAEGKKRTQGAAGNPTRANTEGVASRSHGGDHGRRADEERPESFGMIALLGGDNPGASGRSAFADFEGPGAMGNVFGTTIDDAEGFGGLGLSGIGEGGGGRGAGVAMFGLGMHGTGAGGTCDAECMLGRLGHGSGTGNGQGRGSGCGGLPCTGRGHVTRAPVLRCGTREDDAKLDRGNFPSSQTDRALSVLGAGCATQVNGRLPPEAVQRVVRQSFGRLRGCYEAGLQVNPSLEGRIAVKFVIDREGAVTTAIVQEQSLASTNVARCVGRAFEAMTFPKPEGGIVTVVYPVVFSSS